MSIIVHYADIECLKIGIYATGAIKWTIKDLLESLIAVNHECLKITHPGVN